MDDTSQLRQAVLEWLEQAREQPAIPQAITDPALARRLEWEVLSNAVVLTAPKSEHGDLYGKFGGDWMPRWSCSWVHRAWATRPVWSPRGRRCPYKSVADSFVAFCTAPAPGVEDWLLLADDLPKQTRISLGRYTLQTFTVDELRQLCPKPTLHGLQQGGLDLQLLADAPFVQAPNLDRAPDRRGTN